MSDPHEFESIAAGADQLGVSDSAFRGYIRRGLIKAYRIRGSRLLRVRVADVDALLEPIEAKHPADRVLRVVPD